MLKAQLKEEQGWTNVNASHIFFLNERRDEFINVFRFPSRKLIYKEIYINEHIQVHFAGNQKTDVFFWKIYFYIDDSIIILYF